MSRKGRNFCLIVIATILLSAMFSYAGTIVLASNQPDTLPPAKPKGLTVINRTYTTIRLSWTASTDNIAVRGYELYRDGKKIVVTKKTDYTNINLIPGKEYKYFVKAYDSSGNISEACEPLIVSTMEDCHAPSSPADLKVAAVDYTSVTLSWCPSTDNVGIKSYEVYCNGKMTGTTPVASYTCKRLAPGITYNFYIKAKDIAGNCSNESNIYTVCTKPDTVPPSKPEGLNVSSVTMTEIRLSWLSCSDNVKVAGYEIFCDSKSLGKTKSTSYRVKNLIPGGNHTYSVRVWDGSGNVSIPSDLLKASTLTDKQPPSAPVGLKVVSSTRSSVSIKWNASEDNSKIMGYYIYCYGIKVADTKRTSYTLKGINNLGSAVIWVKAYDLAGNVSEKSNTVFVLKL